ncbi:alanine/glycine:cation symporter family protein [Pelosinus fermentans]|uniref:Amino acid carrier protein n=1 Tax=Pelosinus fermentans JBW45 TaxID=1192197 RepID=I8TSF0_9FIRM|nr:alanine/glycine:cation symporter family protein [Pelosinus fermentans]AJQ26159.1 amino acid carrier protein [Pelosinus fermentans JBW45]
MEFIEKIVGIGNDILWSYVIIFLLIVIGIYFTLRTKFVQIRFAREMLRLIVARGNNESSNSISSFQAFCISTASRVGTGNLAGVAIAIAVGGPGAIFWMWLIALMGSATGFVESTLGQIYKVKDKNGFRGGPAYYMEKALHMRWLGMIFAILITISFGLVFNSVQANTIAAALNEAFGIQDFVVGLVLAVLTAIIIFGGLKRLAKITEWLVPIMAGGYIILALYIMLTNLSSLPKVFSLILGSAFGVKAVAGGGIGAAMLTGIKRGLFSNEAGMGSVPNAASTADVSHPVKQGLVQAFGVFVDTLMVCSATAFIILLSGAMDQGLTGVALLQTALSEHIGIWAKGFIALIVFLFAFSSIIGNYYYGQTNIEFIKNNSTWIFVYRIMVVSMVLFGSMAKISFVWDLADLFMALMALMNIIVIGILGKYAFAALQDYTKQKNAGKDPVFYSDNIEGLVGAECWKKKS